MNSVDAEDVHINQIAIVEAHTIKYKIIYLMRTPFSICVETIVEIAIAASNHNLYFICTQDLFFLNVRWIAENKYFKYRILQIDNSRNEKHVKDRTCS